MVVPGDGESTSFWKDCWLRDAPFADMFPAIFSHAVRKNISVADCYRNVYWDISHRHLTSDRTGAELSVLTQIIAGWEPMEGVADKRVCKMNRSKSFSVRSLYHLSNFGGVLDQACAAIWKCSAPNKNKIFAWLWVKGRIKVRSVLMKQQILASDECPFGCSTSESALHLAVLCPRSATIFQLLGLNVSNFQTMSDLFTIGKISCLPDKKNAWDLVLIAIPWNIWIARNRKVFDDHNIHPVVVARQCRGTLKLWSCRLKNNEKQAVDHWIEDWRD